MIGPYQYKTKRKSKLLLKDVRTGSRENFQIETFSQKELAKVARSQQKLFLDQGLS